MLKLIWTVYNQAVLNTITDIILKIKKAANLNKINLHEEVKANIRIMIKKSEQANFHRKEVELMTKEQEKYKKESETIIYCKHNNHFDNKEGTLSWIIYDPAKYKWKINNEDMNEIYECLEKNFIDWNKKNQEINFNLINENNKSSKGFTLESMKIDYSKNYADKQNEPIKILQKKRTDLYYEEIKESIVNNNNIWLDKIEEEYLNAFDCKTERNTINSFPWGISSAIEGIYEEKLKENESKNLINWIEFEGVTNQ